MLSIRLRRGGVKNKPFYSVVVAESKFPRDGRYIEKLGYYNPCGESSKKDVFLFLNVSRIKYWVVVGAKISDRIKNLLQDYNRNNKDI